MIYLRLLGWFVVYLSVGFGLIVLFFLIPVAAKLGLWFQGFIALTLLGLAAFTAISGRVRS